MAKKPEQAAAKEEKKLASVRDEVLTDIFEDLYRKRARIYRMNFVRGILFGLGSALGGTVVLAIIAWLLSKVVNWSGAAQYIQQLIK